MDPNANLEELHTLAERLAEAPEDPEAASRLAELVLALDEWLASGGFLPDKWRR